ncbi:MAG: Acetoin dehydrogenase operon transcriptional activator AcoR [Citricoccus sp.]|nr:Acetoin dehydrogenase operon transcriptional activator AcoR [Citricoccus sp. WCRC_4]
MRAALRRLINQGLASGVEIGHLVPQEIQNSWRRSISLQVDPAGQPRVEDIGAREDLIRSAGDRVMNRWYASLSDTRTTLLLGNAQGQIVWKRTVDARDRRALDGVGVVEGSDFSEGSTGTNGLGTSIEARSPILVRGGEHYLESLREVACAAAPVIHPLTGRIIGSVSLTAAAEQANDYMVTIARQASQEIADFVLEGANSRDVALARAFRRARTGRRGVLVMNRDTVMSDLPALSTLDGEAQAQIWDQLIPRLGAGEERTFHLADLGVSALVRNVGRPADPVLELQLSSPLEAPARHAATGPGRTAAIEPVVAPPAPDDADEAVATWWAALNRHAAEQPGAELAIPVPRGSDGAEWVRRWSIASARPAHTVGASGEPAQDRPGNGPPEQGPGSAAPAFPPLLRRRAALADLARRLHQGGGPPPRFTAEALGALLSWSWPGDLEELADLVAGLPRTSPGSWTVDVQDLPAHFSAAPRRELSRWEQGERDSMLEALAEAGGNKSDAATLLGIGRTTLYRKLRALSIDQRQIDALTR